jgi:DNA-directed RNA polymerase specialized sigma24 family protein
VSLTNVRDEFLARMVAERGDDRAFEELARRYHPLIVAAARRPPYGADFEDARQEALIGLLRACRDFNLIERRRPCLAFAGIARVSVHWAVGKARVNALTPTQRVLTDALQRLDEGERARIERIPAPAHTDPAQAVILLERLAECAQWARRGVRVSMHDGRRVYSDEQIRRAITIVGNGGTVTAAAAALGAAPITIRRWVEQEIGQRAGLAHERGAGAAAGDMRYRYTQAQVTRALELVRDGHTMTDAAVEVGATRHAVRRWANHAA